MRQEIKCPNCSCKDKDHDVGKCCAMAMGYGVIIRDNQKVTQYGIRDEYGGL